jgi:hypothetical protein
MRNPRLHSVVLLLNAASFCFFGVRWFLTPHVMSQPLGIVLTNADAVTDAQAVYGGLELGVGLFLAYCATRPHLRHVGLLASTLTLTGLGLTRLIGVAMSATPVTGATTQLLATDWLGIVLNSVVCFFGSRPVDRESRAAPAPTLSGT